MGAVKKTISIDKSVVEEASALNANFSATVEAALIEYIHHHRVKKAMDSFGKWSEREETSANMVSNLRKQDDRKYIASNTDKKKSGHR